MTIIGSVLAAAALAFLAGAGFILVTDTSTSSRP